MLIDKIRAVAQPLCDAEDFELVHLEYVTGKKENIVRVFLDKPGGITLDDCVMISRQLGDLIDVHIERMGRYRLEVSSPGPERPLSQKSDFHRFKGSRVKIETESPVEGKKKFTGILESVNEASIVVAVDGKDIVINDQEIRRANLAGQ